MKPIGALVKGVLTMTADEREALAHRWHMDLFATGKLDVAEEILTPDFVAHVGGHDFQGVEEARQLATAMRTAFTDSQITHHDTIISESGAAIRWSSDNTHAGEYFGVPPTGRRIHLEGIDMYHFRDGRIAELWAIFDNLPVLQQMGAAPVATGA
jgi:steroid delta-isomerase-like uncharacterized protein